MSQVNGQLCACDRCGTMVFRRVVGEGEADGGYTRWNNFEPYPEGWGLVEVPGKNSQRTNCMRVCPVCNELWNKILKERFLNTEYCKQKENEQ